ncbi:hypothetical protein K458DRAFT_412519 [Lentithecium fluviatile CBS 122367]|uniref:Zn(2)-C6 fungal-type domain-containing protein n=1 Tax=Lentithecium fluviatile CBS 122367 TaxID=1168545 RepID=A0A6G1JKW8_9PLEO|nr:hypothetical protein K458DRAFT_412519 [Lentithecium fluviatile CBS 122367]
MASVSETQTERTSPSSADNPQRRPHKRVSKACDECRKKRLRCTAGPRPCLNCQLYGAVCTITPTYRKRGPAPSQSKGHGKTSTKSLNTSNEPLLPSLDDTSSAGTAQSACILSNSTTLQLDGTISMSDVTSYVQDLTDGLQQEEQMHYGSSQEPMSMGSYDLLADHPAFDTLGPEGFSHQDVALLGELYSNSAFQSSGVAMNFADLCTPHHDSRSNRMSLPRSYSPQLIETGDKASKFFGSEYLRDFLNSKATEKAIVPGLFVSTSPSDTGFIGFISTGATLAECLQEPSGNDTIATRPKIGEWLSNAVPYVHGVGSHGLGNSTSELPPQSWAQAGIEAYFEHVHIFYPLLDKKTSREYWDQLYAGRISDPTPLDIAILHLVAAIGLLFGVKADSASTPAIAMSEKLYQTAWASLHETLVSIGLQPAQALILHVIYHMYAGRSSKAWSLCGMAVRTAQALGLHRILPVECGYTLEQIRLRSQIWWVAFSLDAILSMVEGRPPAVVEFTCDARPITANWHSDDPYTSNLFLWKVGLARIENRLCSVLSRCDTPHARRSALGEIEQCLTEWRVDMPVGCRPSQEMHPCSTEYSLVASLHLEYFSLSRALYWSCMTCVPAQDEGIHADRTTSQLRRYGREYILCLGSARAFVRTLNSAVENEEEGRIFPLSFPPDQYAAALAILYRNICRNPKHVATRVDLEYFRACKLHLERDVYPGYIVALFGDLLNDMLCSIEKLLARP